MNHTKGEWTPIEFKDTCDLFKGGHIQVVGDNQRSNVAVIPMHWDNAKANAKLIAASPDLYEALISVNGSLKLYDPDSPGIEEADKALSKAEGK